MSDDTSRARLDEARRRAEAALRPGVAAEASREAAPTAAPDTPSRATRALSHVLDDLVTVPGTNVRFGIDPVLSLIPGAGTAVGGAFGAVVLLDAVRLRAPVSVLARMVGNYLVDWLVGLVPVLGAFLDMGYRSNRKNLRLLQRSISEREQVRRASVAYWAGVAGLLMLVLTVLVATTVGLLVWLNDLITPG